MHRGQGRVIRFIGKAAFSFKKKSYDEQGREG